ncbi:MAG: aminoacyl-tRNA hydrolase [Planctomycetes bacterium]|nr:aminoacyl-tRNA hydrolase [Planctomycetota bacterium]
MKVIVGLGNPGAEYAGTRHNVGWMVTDVLAKRMNACRFRRERTVEVAEIWEDAKKVYLLKPLSYMNFSGQALAGWLGTFREIREALQEKPEMPKRSEPAVEAPASSHEDRADAAECSWPGLLVLADDVNLPLGRLRLRPAGSAGGHNGLKDMEKALGSRGYPRLRIGVGEPPGRMDRVDYVLGKFPPADRPLIEKVLETAANAVADWLAAGISGTCDKYNGIVINA